MLLMITVRIFIIFILCISNFCLLMGVSTEKDDFDAKSVYINALHGDDEALKALFLEIGSANEAIPVYALDLMIKNYDRVNLLLTELNKQGDVAMNASLTLLRYGVSEYPYWFQDRSLMAYYLEKKNVFPSDHLFHKVFNKFTLGSVIASSVLDENRYTESNIIDDDINTAWVEGRLDGGVGEWVRIEFQSFLLERNRFNTIEIINGYAKNEMVFRENNRVRRARLEFSDGQSHVITLKDTMTPQRFRFQKNVFSFVKFTILDVYRGTTYNDTCISELRCFYEDDNE